LKKLRLSQTNKRKTFDLTFDRTGRLLNRQSSAAAPAPPTQQPQQVSLLSKASWVVTPLPDGREAEGWPVSTVGLTGIQMMGRPTVLPSFQKIKYTIALGKGKRREHPPDISSHYGR